MHACWMTCCRKRGTAIASEFSREFFSANRIVKADLHCARQPREQDLDKIKAELKSLYDATEVLLDVSVD